MCTDYGHHTLRVWGGVDVYVYCFSGFSRFWVDFRVDDWWCVVYCEGEWCVVGVTHQVPGNEYDGVDPITHQGCGVFQAPGVVLFFGELVGVILDVCFHRLGFRV